MLTYDPKKRISAEKALEDPWFSNLSNKNNKIPISTL